MRFAFTATEGPGARARAVQVIDGAHPSPRAPCSEPAQAPYYRNAIVMVAWTAAAIVARVGAMLSTTSVENHSRGSMEALPYLAIMSAAAEASPSSAYAFPGGVRDVAAQRAFVAVAGDGLVAVDLARGALLWRRAAVGRPVAATPTRVVTLDGGKEGFFLRLLDASSGEEVARASPPEWSAAQVDGARLEDLDVQATPRPPDVELAWRLRSTYRGGAAPPREIAPTGQPLTSGRFRLAVETGAVLAAGGAGHSTANGAEPSRVHPTPDAQVIARHDIGARSFILAVRPAGAGRALVLEARAAAGGEPLWTTVLSDVAPRSPAALRPKSLRP